MTPQDAKDLELGRAVRKLDDEVRWILGRPCFTVIRIAQRLRAHGFKIETKAEDEQAACIQWMLTMYATHGAAWRVEGDKFLNSVPTVDAAALESSS